MMTYEAMNVLLQFGILLVAGLTLVVGIIALVINRKRSNRPTLSRNWVITSSSCTPN